MSKWELEGEVEVLRLRVYPVDPYGDYETNPLATHASVLPGRFPIYKNDFGARRWVMTGTISERNGKISDGLFLLGGGDTTDGIPISVTSKVFGPEEWLELIADPSLTGRLAFHLKEKR